MGHIKKPRFRTFFFPVVFIFRRIDLDNGKTFPWMLFRAGISFLDTSCEKCTMARDSAGGYPVLDIMDP